MVIMKMALISQRSCHLIGLENDEINWFVKQVKTFLEQERIPEEYAVNVYKDAVACCGFFPIGVAVEIQGPKEQIIKDLDFMIYSKIIEICEREGIETHECDPLEII